MEVEKQSQDQFQHYLSRGGVEFQWQPCRVVEAAVFDNTNRPQFEISDRNNETALKSWMATEPLKVNGQEPSSLLRVILGKRVTKDSSGAQRPDNKQLLTFPFSGPAAFREILEMWSLPRTILRAISRGEATYSRVLRSNNTNDDQWNGCVMRMGRDIQDHQDLVIALSWNITKHITYGMILGCEPSDETFISNAIQYSMQSCGHPLLLVATFAGLQLTRQERAYRSITSALQVALEEAGLEKMDGPRVISQGTMTRSSFPGNIDYNLVIRIAMDIFRNSGYLTIAIQRFQTQLQSVIEDLDMVDPLLSVSLQQHLDLHKRRIRTQMDGLMESFSSLVERTRHQTNESSLVMTALWNIVAQQDNSITQELSRQSTKIAEESKRIAEESRNITKQSQDLAAESKLIAAQSKALAEESRNFAKDSKDLAKESRDIANEARDLARKTHDISAETRNIADAAKRDSASMSAIATLTMFFLPLSYVATFLGMPIFNWQAKPGEAIARFHFIRIYLAAALPLTAVVVVLWFSWYRWSELKRKPSKGERSHCFPMSLMR